MARRRLEKIDPESEAEFEGLDFEPFDPVKLAEARKVFDEDDDGDVSDLPDLPDDDPDVTVVQFLPKRR